MSKTFDVVVVGTGIAGLTAAIYLKEAGLNVAIITKNSDISEANTNYAQGGIIAWKNGDSPEKLEKDILNAGCYYNNFEAVKVLAQEGPKLVFEFLIDKVGIQFSSNSKGELDYTEEAAHSERRILHFSDYTGEKIEDSLIAYAAKIGINILTNKTAIDLITNNHHSNDYQELYKPREVLGLYVLNNNSGEVETFFSNSVILATGGVGNLYQYTTNPSSATGDGISMAYRAGADIINSEFIQFHPTALFHKDIKRFLISESLRGEGAKLINHNGEQFMERYSPQKELAPRDVVARAIYQEMNRTGKEYLFLDLAHFYNGSTPIKERFSKIYNTCLSGGIDITKQPIPVVPAAHFFCGGIKVDINGQSSVKNLYAIGETSCTGLHGANRLASDSLLEGLLWGKRSALDIVKNNKQIDKKRLDNIPNWKMPKNIEEFDPILIYQDWNAIKLTMWNYTGIIRTKKGLERAQSDLNYHSHRIFKFYKEARLNRDIIELRNAIVTAQIIVDSAMRNGKSIGCHYVEE
ncbi:MAG TPA: L-aspartate oxidase [Spirochaetota bacterium]|nr:L-aspartate oxidase [Spirochaetota bacterium]HOS31775.1 L-aspartate oxidase [Spirochaetota bacterium]HOS55191.1 L-aspartate oxidase [Spirochaetota bacterium]HPK61525.1 L-aspartate oxidase [Spirochaetota bacterium]HQF77389.1 L-aspartate oxidase [Spirochaetota bacterium]